MTQRMCLNLWNIKKDLKPYTFLQIYQSWARINNLEENGSKSIFQSQNKHLLYNYLLYFVYLHKLYFKMRNLGWSKILICVVNLHIK